MKIEYLSAFVLSQLYGSFLSVLTPGDRGAARKLFDARSRWPFTTNVPNPILRYTYLRN